MLIGVIEEIDKDFEYKQNMSNSKNSYSYKCRENHSYHHKAVKDKLVSYKNSDDEFEIKVF